jgi:hypothetical protein
MPVTCVQRYVRNFIPLSADRVRGKILARTKSTPRPTLQSEGGAPSVII